MKIVIYYRGMNDECLHSFFFSDCLSKWIDLFTRYRHQ